MHNWPIQMAQARHVFYPSLCSYVDFYKLPEPCDDIHSVLDSVSKRIGALTKGVIIYTIALCFYT